MRTLHPDDENYISGWWEHIREIHSHDIRP